MNKKLLYLTLGIFATNTLTAQIPGEKLYLTHAKPPVVYAENNREMPFAWCGGANNPQLAMVDLNKDGIQDLVIFDPGIGARTFLNTSRTPGSPKYTYNPEFQANFPPIRGYVKFEDYNRDEIPDLIQAGTTGIYPQRGYYNSQGQLCFDAETRFRGLQGLYYMTGGSGLVNAYVSPSDLPAAADIDHDGDLDFIAYEPNGNYIYLYKNCQQEDGLPKDSIKICVPDACWGKTTQYYQRSLKLGSDCGVYGTSQCKGCPDNGSANKTTHSGNTLCFVDLDNDGDYDVFNGNISYSDIQYLVNGKSDINYTRDSIIKEDTLWGANGKIMNIPTMPAAFWVDIDNDGKKDLAFTPYAPNSENYKCIVYYKNKGTNGAPNFFYQSDTLFMQDMIDVGSGASPVFYDYNKDGKPDMFIGNEGYYQAANGTLRPSIQYYENTSTTGKPSFTIRSRDFMGLSSGNYTAASLTMGDLDGDGMDDLVIGNKDGTLTYFRNNAASATIQPVWQNPKILNDQAGTISVGGYATPFLYDLNKDGKKDIIVGSQMGRLYYYRNLGGATAPGYIPYLNKITDTLGGITVMEDESPFTLISPYIGKIDNTGKDYLLLGSRNGIVYRYDNFQSGTSSKYTRVDSGFSKINVVQRARLSIADVDGDGSYEMVVGNAVGGVMMYKQYYSSGIGDIQAANGGVTIYPNPASNTINIGWLPSFGTGEVYITLVSITGQKMYQGTSDASRTNAQIDVSALPAGTYYCIVRTSDNQASSPVSIVR